MNIKELAIKRTSIRSYVMEDLPSFVLEEIKNTIVDFTPLNNEKIAVRIVNKETFDKETKGFFKIKAPHYVMLYGSECDDSLFNVGYVGELIVLKLTEMNLGSCWLGGATSMQEEKGLKFIIAIAFGKTNTPFRQLIAEAKRKTMDQIAEGTLEPYLDLLNTAKLAPSAMNGQPWYFKCHNQKIEIYKKKRLLEINQIERLQKIDIGIVTAHFSSIEFMLKKESIESPKGYYYLYSLYF